MEPYHSCTTRWIDNIIGHPNPLKYLFYTTAQITNHFPSDDYPGNNVWDLNETFSNYPPLQDIITELGNPPQTVNFYQISNSCYNYGIRATAAFLFWFASEVGLITTNDKVITRNYEQIIQETETLSNVWAFSCPESVIKSGREYFFYQWSDGEIQNPRLPDGVITNYFADYKGVHQTISQSSIENNNQRKIVFNESENAYYFTYESLGRIWLEKSTDAGMTWQLLNNNSYLQFSFCWDENF